VPPDTPSYRAAQYGGPGGDPNARRWRGLARARR